MEVTEFENQQLENGFTSRRGKPYIPKQLRYRCSANYSKGSGFVCQIVAHPSVSVGEKSSYKCNCTSGKIPSVLVQKTGQLYL